MAFPPTIGEAQRDRRPIPARRTPWARALAGGLTRSAITPDQISLASVAFAAAGAAALVWLPGPLGDLVCSAAVGLRLLANMLDGMVAVEGGKRSPWGALYNELPDRLSDSLFLVALGYACGQSWLGWLGALGAAFTAYLRALGGSLGLPQDFRGPLAKPQRMAVLAAGCALAAGEGLLRGTQHALLAAAVVIALGSFATCVTRTAALARALGGR